MLGPVMDPLLFGYVHQGAVPVHLCRARIAMAGYAQVFRLGEVGKSAVAPSVEVVAEAAVVFHRLGFEATIWARE